jgi:hypothetical protein
MPAATHHSPRCSRQPCQTSQAPPISASAEHEELFDESLNPVGVRDNHSGEVSGFAPPGDIHRIRNDGSETAISLHIYGTDITRVGTSARRNYN